VREWHVEDLFSSFMEERAPVRISDFLNPLIPDNQTGERPMASLSLKLLAVGAAISIGAILGANTSNAAPVAAVPIVVDYGTKSVPVVQIDHRYGHYRPPYRPAFCTPRQAANKANRMGIYRARVAVNRNVIRVAGWKRGLRTVVVFARAPGCPFIR
jgi:hypothetical protein